ncbi:TolC family outer membrane protein [Rhizorhapis sp. SPR117]|uniref:TolC family outer membrane protein n=1 Tax=Rhizorhapis sp. SPR117 TaxID=2912611 RepID=UPI001F01D975|nr:TolC family outer membrane protein [Rhizorhapis sp. SPR117]
MAFAAPANAKTLDEAIAEAIQHAPRLAQAEAEARAADGAVTQARGAGLPLLGVSGSIGTGRIDPRGFFGLQAASTTPRMAQAGIEQPLFAGGAISGAIGQAKAGRAAARAHVDATRAELAASVAQAYSDVLVAAKQLEHYGKLKSEMTEILRQAKLRFQSGDSPSTDVSQAKARLAEAEAGMAQAEGDQALARAHFVNLVGSTPDDLAPLPLAPTTPAELDEAVSIAMTNSPRIAQARAAVDAAHAAARGSRSGYLPAVSAFAEASSVRDQFFPDYAADSVTVGVRARWNIFDSGRTAGKVEEADGKRDAAMAQLRAAQADIQEAVIRTWQGLRTARDVRLARQAQDEASQEALRSVRLEVQTGSKPHLALLDAERDAIAASTGATQAEGGVVVAAYQLRALLGQY